MNRFRILRRLRGIGPRTNKKPKNNRLSEVQEQAFLRYILSLDEIGHSIRYDQINKVTNNMFRTNDNSISAVDQYWIQRFINRHLELYKVK